MGTTSGDAPSFHRVGLLGTMLDFSIFFHHTLAHFRPSGVEPLPLPAPTQHAQGNSSQQETLQNAGIVTNLNPNSKLQYCKCLPAFRSSILCIEPPPWVVLCVFWGFRKHFRPQENPRRKADATGKALMAPPCFRSSLLFLAPFWLTCLLLDFAAEQFGIDIWQTFASATAFFQCQNLPPSCDFRPLIFSMFRIVDTQGKQYSGGNALPPPNKECEKPRQK